MTHIVLPALWLILLIVGLPQFAETVYTPILPDMAHSFQTSDTLAEYTLTIYLVGFAVGILFWGKLSDRIGRKPCVMAGLMIFMCGSLGCYYSSTITLLMCFRFIQAFGGSIGSVLGQAISRDAFHGPELGRVYASIGGALAIFPAIGPVIGGVIASYGDWHSIFLFLILCAIIVFMQVFLFLPETHHPEKRTRVSMRAVALSLLTNKHVIGCGLLVGIYNGISFSYFAEGPFYLREFLGVPEMQYSQSFVILALAMYLGGRWVKYLQRHQYDAKKIIEYGLRILILSTIGLSAMMWWHLSYTSLPVPWLIGATLISQMLNMFGMTVVASNALAQALVDYKWCIGTASSLFGFFYYCIVSLVTLGMGALHNDTLLPMPVYFLSLGLVMYMTHKTLLRD